MDALHLTFIILFLAIAAVRIYYGLHARTGRNEKEKTAEPAVVWVRFLLGGPAMLPILIYVFRPQLLNWSSVPLRPAWRWIGTSLFAASVGGLA